MSADEVEPTMWAVVPPNMIVHLHDVVQLHGYARSVGGGWAVVTVSEDGRLAGVVHCETVETVR